MDTKIKALQGSAEWHKQRIGKFTSSEIFRLMTEPKLVAEKKAGLLSAGAITYVLEKVHEEITGECAESFDTIATVWGIQNEPLAREWYEKKNGVTVLEDGFEQTSTSYGGSVDGLVGEDGGIEIKCPYKGSNHLEHLLIDSQEYMKDNFKNYYWQCVSNAFINKRKWWDFISFDPRLNYESGYFQIRIYPTDEDFELLTSKIEKAVEMKLQLVNRFTK